MQAFEFLCILSISPAISQENGKFLVIYNYIFFQNYLASLKQLLKGKFCTDIYKWPIRVMKRMLLSFNRLKIVFFNLFVPVCERGKVTESSGCVQRFLLVVREKRSESLSRRVISN